MRRVSEDLPSWLDGGSEHGSARRESEGPEREDGPVEWARRGLETASGAAGPGRGRGHRPARPRGRGPARRRRTVTLGVLGLAAAAGLIAILRAAAGGGHSHAPAAPGMDGAAGGLPAALYSPAQPPPAWSGPLPYPVLIADQGHHRLVEVSPAKKVLWQYPAASGTAAGGTASSGPASSGPASGGAAPAGSVSFAPDGRSVIATGPNQSVIERIDFYSRTVLWHFGRAGRAGGGATLLQNPTAGYLLPDGDTIVADVSNCRELTVDPAGRIAAAWGRPQSGYCQTDTAHGLFGYPNGDQPQPNGDILMTFGSGDRIALLSPQGAVLWDKPAPTLYGAVASDAQMASGGDVLVTGQGRPGVVVLWNPQTGAIVWQYHVTSGSGALNDPTMAVPLPGGNVLVVDGGNNRVVVIDPKTNALVWSYTGTTTGGGLRSPAGAALDEWRNWQAAGKG